MLFRDNTPETVDITSNSEAAVTLLEKVHYRLGNKAVFGSAKVISADESQD